MTTSLTQGGITGLLSVIIFVCTQFALTLRNYSISYKKRKFLLYHLRIELIRNRDIVRQINNLSNYSSGDENFEAPLLPPQNIIMQKIVTPDFLLSIRNYDFVNQVLNVMCHLEYLEQNFNKWLEKISEENIRKSLFGLAYIELVKINEASINLLLNDIEKKFPEIVKTLHIVNVDFESKL